MPPREFESGPTTLVIRSNSLDVSRGVDRVHDNVETHFCKYDDLLQKHNDLGRFPSEVLDQVEKLLKTAKNIDSNIEGLDDCAIFKACSVAVRDAVSKGLDAVKKAEGVEQQTITTNGAAVFMLGLGRTLEFLAKMEAVVTRPLDLKLEAKLKDLLSGRDQADVSSIRLSDCSSCIAFEIKTDAVSWHDVASSMSLPLSVSVEPFIFARASDILDDCINLESYQRCQVSIESCSHRPHYRSSSGGIVGEALVRVRIATGPSHNSMDKKRKLKMWGEGGDVNKFRVVEARAAQTKAYPEQVQSKVELYVSSTFGDSSLVVTMKVDTWTSPGTEEPRLDIQLVLEPPQSTA